MGHHQWVPPRSSFSTRTVIIVGALHSLWLRKKVVTTRRALGAVGLQSEKTKLTWFQGRTTKILQLSNQKCATTYLHSCVGNNLSVDQAQMGHCRKAFKLQSKWEGVLRLTSIICPLASPTRLRFAQLIQGKPGVKFNPLVHQTRQSKCRARKCCKGNVRRDSGESLPRATLLLNTM